MTPLYDLSSLPSTLSTMTPPMLRSGEEKGVEDDRNHNSLADFVSCEPGLMPSKKDIRKCEDKGHSSFLRRRVSEAKLSREEAWQFYLAKLDEEANYLTVPEEVEEDICTCPSCTASYEVLYEGYMLHSKYSDIIANNDTANVTLASDDEVKMMKSILHEKENTMCVIM
eukprot:TRINITY_DN14888_c0_g1_i1.p1 TRINITY_DN14888_c0_g1~~TRINITY_DN14888_c0_g1_i1.p1  ORF type:complete len:169 (+),score=50.29 TRINITY_DN14888_c0_g1_i1:34-540(+)